MPRAACLVFESFGVVAELASDDPGLLRSAQEMLPPDWRATGRAPERHFGLTSEGSISVDGRHVEWDPDSRRALQRLGAVIRHQLAQDAPHHVFIHAGVVEAGGCGIVVPGRSHSGKSTLVAELVRLGATYGSDEYAAVDAAGAIHPFAKPLSIRSPRAGAPDTHLTPPADQIARGPLQCRMLIFTSFVAGERWHPSARARSEGALMLLQHTVPARARPAAAMRAAGHVVEAAQILAGDRGEASEVAHDLMEKAEVLMRDHS